MDNIEVGKFIKAKLKEKDITQEQLAEKIGISSSAISQGLSGKNLFDVNNLMEISKILDIDLDTILNAGKERETNLERLAKLNPDKFLKEDPELKTIIETDSKGKKLLDYLIEHKNILLIRELKEKGIMNQVKGKGVNQKEGSTLFMALLVNHYKDLNIPLEFFNWNNGLPNFKSRKPSGLHKPYTETFAVTEYDLLTENDKKFVDALLNTNDIQLLKHLPYFDKSIKDNIIPELVFYAIQFDKLNIVQYEEDKHKPYEKTLSSLQQRKYMELFKYAIHHKSRRCIKYFYEKLNLIEYEKIFKLLIDTNDIDFVKWFVDNFPEKLKDRFNQQTDKRFDNYSSLIDLAKNDDINLFKFSILFSNKEGLNKTLQNLPKDKIEFILELLKAGANYTYHDGYSSKPIELIQISETIRYILNKIDKK